MQEIDAPGYFSVRSRYYNARESKQYFFPLKSAGFYNKDYALITPSVPVSAKHFSTSSYVWMPPFATTGMFTYCFIFFIIYQSHAPTLSLFCYFVRPCTVSSEHPAAITLSTI